VAFERKPMAGRDHRNSGPADVQSSNHLSDF